MCAVLYIVANSASAASGIIYFVSYIPFFFIQNNYETMGKSLKLASCLLPNVAMAMGITVIGYHEGTGETHQVLQLYINLRCPL